MALSAFQVSSKKMSLTADNPNLIELYRKKSSFHCENLNEFLDSKEAVQLKALSAFQVSSKKMNLTADNPNLIELYRRKSSFHCENLNEFLDSKEAVQLKNELFRVLEQDPLFHRSQLTQSLDDIRKITHLRARRIVDYGFLEDPRGETQPLYYQTLLQALVQYDICVLFKATITPHFFGACIRGLGTAEQQKYYTDSRNEMISGCFALTEVAHGTDAKGMRTTATFDPDAKQFVLHTKDFQAAKCWIGNLGQGATHATVFAQLITPNGQNQGLHAFVVPIRDPNTFLAYPGVIIGDMGEKIGLNGMDNGFCMFNHYRIPKENLLSKLGEVTEDGQYLSPITDPRKRFGFSLGTLIGGRVATLGMCIGFLTNAITIAIRYSAVRKQFGPSDDQELPIIEYPLQQWRLFPHLAALFAMKATSRFINTRHFHLMKTLNNPTQMLSQEEMDSLTEMHALLSAGKAVFSWTAQAAIQQCREACGGHGYLKCAGFSELRNNNDANCTYEGDNNVLQQQASNWLVRLWRDRGKQPFVSPLGSVAFIYKSRPNAMSVQTEQELCHPPVILEAYQWLICWLAEKTYNTYQTHAQEGRDVFTARNHSQAYRGRSLSIAYAEHFMIKCLWELSDRAEEHSFEAKIVLTKLCALFSLTSLEKHLVFLHQGGYIDENQSELVQATILLLCGQLKNEAVSLVDVIAPTDFVLNSVLGHSNGEVYKNLEQALLTSPGNLERPSWWTELSGKLRSRL